MLYVSLYTYLLVETKNVLGVTIPRHLVQLEFWDPLNTFHSITEEEGCYLLRVEGSKKQLKVDKQSLQ